jgi:hypothetical protein
MLYTGKPGLSIHILKEIAVFQIRATRCGWPRSAIILAVLLPVLQFFAAPSWGQGPSFSVQIRDILGQPLKSRVRLVDANGALLARFEAPEGTGSFSFRAGRYTALVDVYDDGVPILVHVAPLDLSGSGTGSIEVSVLEGSGSRNLAQFDRDLDLALDSLEAEQGTDPEDARSTPGSSVYTWASPVLSDKGGWYGGELHAYSKYGPGSESVARLIRRAESTGLDFLAIADPGSVAAALDPDFTSQKLVLIPAYEWGTDELGSVLVFAPDEVFARDVSRTEAQALAVRLQARGGLFSIAHPASPDRPWNWGLNYFNGVEVWWRDWRRLRPIGLANLSDEWRSRDEEGDFKYPIAVAAATRGLSGNGQATIFYDIATTHGMKAAVTAGTGSKGRKERLGSPVTFVYAREKSLNGMLEGIRKGRTYVSKSIDGPFIEFQADILSDDQIDVGMGGIIPINVKSRFIAGVSGAKGAQLEVLMNGYPIRSQPIESDKLTMSFEDVPNAFGAYRMRIVDSPDKREGYGFSEVLAMSSPIYAQSYFVEGGPDAGRDGWIEVPSNYREPRPGDEFDPSTLDPSQVVTLNPRN